MRKALLVFFVSLLATLTVAVLLSRFVIPYALVNWDEATFLLWGYKIWSALKFGNWQSLLTLTVSQFQYPPLQSWFLAAMLLPFGFSIQMARTISLFWFILAACLIFVVSRQINQKHIHSAAGKHGSAIGLASVLLFITSPLVLYFASVAYKELMGTTLTLIVIMLYIEAVTGKNLKTYLWVAAALIILFFTKYQYIVIPVLAMVVEAAVQWFLVPRQRKTLLLGHLMIAIPIALTAKLWLLFPTSRIGWFIDIMTNSSFNYTGGTTDTLRYLLFFPRALLFMYSPSLPIGILLVGSLVGGALYIKRQAYRILWIAALINITLATVHTINIQERYIMTTVPFLMIIAATMLTDGVAFILKQKALWIKTVTAITAVVFVGIISKDLPGLFSRVYAVGSQKSLGFNLLDFKDVWYNYDTATWPKRLPWEATEQPEDVLRFVAQAVDISKPVDIAGASSSFSPDYFKLFFAMERKKGNITHLPYERFVVTLIILPTSRYYTRDYILVTGGYRAQALAFQHNPSYRPFTHKRFEELGIDVGIYVPRSK